MLDFKRELQIWNSISLRVLSILLSLRTERIKRSRLLKRIQTLYLIWQEFNQDQRKLKILLNSDQSHQNPSLN